MTPTSISTLSTGPGLAASPPPAGDADAFAALLKGLETGNPIADAGTALPDGRQAVAVPPAGPALPGLEAVLETGEGIPMPPGPGCAVEIETPLLPAVPGESEKGDKGALPAGLQKITPDSAAPGKGRASLHARALPMPFRALMGGETPAPDAPLTAEPASEKASKAAAKAEEIVVDPAFAPEAPRVQPPSERKPITVAARVADTPAIERATAALDPVRAPEPMAEEAPAVPTSETRVDGETRLPSDAAQQAPIETAKTEGPPAPDAQPEPSAADVRAPAPQAAEIAARATDPARDRNVPPAYAGLTPAAPHGRKTPGEPETARTRVPAGRPFEALAAIAAGQEPGRPLVAALTGRTPAEPAAFAELVSAIDPAAPAPAGSGQPGSYGFHPATPVQMRGADLVGAGAPVLDTSRADWLQSMIERIGEIRLEGGAREAQIRLAPDALGTVDIRIEQRDDRIHVTMTAETSQARALLAEASPRLQDMAEARGLRLTQSSVDGGQSQNQQRRQGGDAPGTPAAPASARRSADPETARSQDRIA